MPNYGRSLTPGTSPDPPGSRDPSVLTPQETLRTHTYSYIRYRKKMRDLCPDFKLFSTFNWKQTIERPSFNSHALISCFSPQYFSDLSLRELRGDLLEILPTDLNWWPNFVRVFLYIVKSQKLLNKIDCSRFCTISKAASRTWTICTANLVCSSLWFLYIFFPTASSWLIQWFPVESCNSPQLFLIRSLIQSLRTKQSAD